MRLRPESSVLLLLALQMLTNVTETKTNKQKNYHSYLGIKNNINLFMIKVKELRLHKLTLKSK